MVVEGIGGLHVPINMDGFLVADLIKKLRLPCVVVARSALGTINHTLLTLEALRRRKIEIAGVVVNGPRNRENRKAIEGFGNVLIIGEVDTLRPLGPAALSKAARSFDRAGRLKPYLGL